MSESLFQYRTCESELEAIKVRVCGTVQGVGFRPTVWKIANQLQLSGYVLNDGDGVQILLQGPNSTLSRFEAELREQCPPLASIESIQISPATVDPKLSQFQITHSVHTASNTGISADAAICHDCLTDIRSSDNRRYLYPFTNCTNCGPRFSIIRSIPYDRKYTSMASFTQCPECQREYDNPADRRFHAQPNACPVCGPHIWLEYDGESTGPESAIQACAELLRDGNIVAVKGIGGFHLACDATNAEAINELRVRKNRPDKALAIMARSVSAIRQYCRVDDMEVEALLSSSAPIVVLNRLDDCILPANLAPGLSQLGFMLPYSPLHVELLDAVEFPIVLTSGNLSEEPQCITNEQAQTRLASIADAFLLHNRDIINRVDDSVVRKLDGEVRTLRRARGLAPGTINLPGGFSNNLNILAYGSELKNTFCLLQHGHAMLSQHMGDLENAGTWQDYEYNLTLYQSLYEFQPTVLAVDSHPEYLSSKLGRDVALESHLKIVDVQHHHAHIAAVLAEHQKPANCQPVIGIALDGLGFGTDNTIWGGEVFLADYIHCQRLAALKPTALPGGAMAIKQPWRSTYAHLRNSNHWQNLSKQNPDFKLVRFFAEKPVASIEHMISKGVNSPLTSSCGRLFDAVAGALGVSADEISYEGQAAIELEALILPSDLETEIPYRMALSGCDPIYIDPTPMWNALLDDLESGLSASRISARFHLGLANCLFELCCQIREQTKTEEVALSGGVFQNKTLLESLANQLRDAQFSVLQAKDIPANDGGIALGQVMITAAMAAAASPRSAKPFLAGVTKMCLGIPGKIIEITDPENLMARVDVSGVQRQVNIACIIDDSKPIETCLGDWVLVHVGFAMSRIDEDEAHKTLALLSELEEAQEELIAMQQNPL